MKSVISFTASFLIWTLLFVTVTSLLPPPEDDAEDEVLGQIDSPAPNDNPDTASASTDVNEPEEEEELRGLRGQANPLAALAKSAVKCGEAGNHGIKNECSKYIECRKKGSITVTRYCPSGKFFDHFRRVCIASGDAECRDTCPQDGEKHVDTSNSGGWLECVRGVPMPKRCPKGYIFNHSSFKCEEEDESEEEEDRRK